MDETEVTNEQFEKFVKAICYITIAEQAPKPEEFPGVASEELVAVSLVFTPTSDTGRLEESEMVAVSEKRELRHGREWE